MLAADKLQLQSALKQQATALKEKEFNLHHSNLMTVGTQAAVLAGLDITMFIEFAPPSDENWGQYEIVARLLKMLYYAIIIAAFGANMTVVSQTTVLSVLGASLALRGPDGSMMTATDGLYEERRSVFQVFGFGLACTVSSVLVSVWLLLRWEAALICWLVSLVTCHRIYSNYRRVSKRFDFDERDTVDFRDIMEGPAAIRTVAWNKADYLPSSSAASSSAPSNTGAPLDDRSRIRNRPTTTNGSTSESRPSLFWRTSSTSKSDANNKTTMKGQYSKAESGGDQDAYQEDDDDAEYKYNDVEMQTSRLLSQAQQEVKRRPNSSSPSPSTFESIRTI